MPKKGPLLPHWQRSGVKIIGFSSDPRNGQKHVFKTPSRMLNMPFSDHLTNHGITKMARNKKSAHVTQKKWDELSTFGEVNKIPGMSNNFRRT
jgi:hypothetical protein